MESRLQQWGNSSGIRIPKAYLEDLDLKSGDKVNIESDKGKIIITKVKEEISLKERIDKYNGLNLCDDFKWDAAKGKELW